VSALAPVEYSRLIMAALAGYIVFSEIPDLWAVAGMILIAGASFVVLRFGAIPAPPIDPDKV
ncbi:MAG: EamA/RhaT family transporter, partial [Pseudomonadota bacterium]